MLLPFSGREEEKFDPGRSVGTLKVIDPNYLDFPPFTGPATMVLVSRFKEVHLLYREIFLNWKSSVDLAKTGGPLGLMSPEEKVIEINSFVSGTKTYFPSVEAEHLKKEAFVFQIRRFFETLLQSLQLEFYSHKFGKRKLPKKIKIDSLGKLFQANKNGTSEVYCKILFGNPSEHPEDIYFLALIDTLADAMRHQPFFHEGYHQIGESTPTLVGVELKSSNLSARPTYHNHNCACILMGFQDTAKNVLARVKAAVIDSRDKSPHG